MLTFFEWCCTKKMRKDNQYTHIGLKPKYEGDDQVFAGAPLMDGYSHQVEGS